MADPAANDSLRPFATFNFLIEIVRDGEARPLVSAAFAECEGLEMTQEVRTVREGGNNRAQIRLAGPAAFGTITLRRGMTDNFEIWKWFSDSLAMPALRAEANIIILSADRQNACARFRLSRCLPLRLKAPSLIARESRVAIEELQLLCETFSLVGSD